MERWLERNRIIPRRAEWLTDPDLQFMSDKEFGWYALLVTHAWLNWCRLPDDPKKLARLARAGSTEEFERDSANVLACFERATDDSGSYLVPTKLHAQWADNFRIWQQNKAAGKRSAAVRTERHLSRRSIVGQDMERLAGGRVP